MSDFATIWRWREHYQYDFGFVALAGKSFQQVRIVRNWTPCVPNRAGSGSVLPGGGSGQCERHECSAACRQRRTSRGSHESWLGKGISSVHALTGFVGAISRNMRWQEPVLRFSEGAVGPGRVFFEQAARQDQEGTPEGQ